ncbi:hypothetical protein CONCODRAFT_13187 [Conidiobolus coronatus NRRL 28638]|uniref:Uncharacterized protein n=1 Tax=Conidiobolus coronatus (strain ATCC 28846 / CBS 209.66 / NRRL 28638) TaxID=796925 RepID=A0A137NRG5_CONC2|nr:hypothetical protein CONCODRAFT_13187 [Conidiobolus coronatus NRRL 28638]|eukprot:KXN65280.1 hypothetical protein CONCODRAFT_13187 [Conidiobolus coronatus NRRL 28638]
MLVKYLLAPILMVDSSRQLHFGDNLQTSPKSLEAPGSKLNRVAMKLYNLALENIKKSDHIYPLLISAGPKLTLIDKRAGHNIYYTTKFQVPLKFTILKQVSHTSLGLVSILTSFVQKEIPVEFLEPLGELESSLLDIKESLHTYYNGTLTQNELYINSHFIDLTLDFLRYTRPRKFVDDISYFSYNRAIEQIMKDNMQYSANAFVEELHNSFQALVKQMNKGSEYWNDLKVVFLSNHFAKNRNMALLYFQQAIPKLELCDQIYFSDTADENAIIHNVGKHYLELNKLGTDLFRDKGFMHRDILGEGTEIYLNKLKRQGRIPISF